MARKCRFSGSVRHCAPALIEEEGEIGADGGEGAEQRLRQAEKAGRGNDREQQNQEVIAFERIGDSRAEESKDELENHGGCAAPVGVQQRQMAFDQLRDGEAGQEQPLRGVVRQINQRAEHEGEQHVLNGEVEAGSRNRGG